MSRKPVFEIPMRKAELVILLIFTAIFIPYAIEGATTIRGGSFRVVLVFMILADIICSLNYLFYNDRIIVRMGFLPIRRIWKHEIGYIGIQPAFQSRPSRRANYPSGIICVLKPYEKHDIITDFRVRFRYKHPTKIMRMQLPEDSEKRDQIVEQVTKYWGPLEELPPKKY